MAVSLGYKLKDTVMISKNRIKKTGADYAHFKKIADVVFGVDTDTPDSKHKYSHARFSIWRAMNNIGYNFSDINRACNWTRRSIGNGVEVCNNRIREDWDYRTKCLLVSEEINNDYIANEMYKYHLDMAEHYRTLISK